MLFEKQKICITKILLENLICFYGKYHKSLIMSEVFYKKRVYYSTARPPASSTTSCLSATSSLQQISQFKRALPPSPHPQKYTTECPYV